MVLPRCLFPSAVWTENVRCLSLAYACHMHRPSYPFALDCRKYVCWKTEWYSYSCSFLHSFLTSSHLVPIPHIIPLSSNSSHHPTQFQFLTSSHSVPISHIIPLSSSSSHHPTQFQFLTLSHSVPIPHIIPLSYNFLNAQFARTFWQFSSFTVLDQVSHTDKTIDKIIF